MTTLFKATTSYGYNIKSLATYFSFSIHTGYLHISEKGIKSTSKDNYSRVLIDLFLDAENFDCYYFTGDAISTGINFMDLKNILKSMKKTDSLTLTITDDEPNSLIIMITPHNGGCFFETKLDFINKQNISLEVPEVKMYHIVVNSKEFQQMCKELKNSLSPSSSVYVECHRFDDKFDSVTFSGSPDSRYDKTITFSNQVPQSFDPELVYRNVFSPAMILNLQKLVNICKRIHLYFDVLDIMKLSLQIEELGHMDVYLNPTDNEEDFSSSEEDIII